VTEKWLRNCVAICNKKKFKTLEKTKAAMEQIALGPRGHYREEHRTSVLLHVLQWLVSYFAQRQALSAVVVIFDFSQQKVLEVDSPSLKRRLDFV